MEEKEKFYLPLSYNLQFFADDKEEQDEEQDDDSENKDDNNGGSDDGKDSGKKKEKTFTQSQVNKLMSREKKEGRSALLNALGFKTEDEAKKAVDLYNALIGSQKSEEDKAKEDASKLETQKTDAEKRAEIAENKLACIMAGVNKESVDDVLAIASTKIDENNDLAKVLESMRGQAKYAVFFEESQEDDKNKDTGTGHDTSHGRKKSEAKKGSYGASLAERANKAQNNKSSYFNS
jgi:hypothetical protein